MADDLRVGWQISAQAHPDHARWAHCGGRLFATTAWAKVLATLGAEPLHAWHPGRGVGVVVPVFRRFGFRIGFLGLPWAGAEFDAMPAGALAQCAAGIAATARLAFVRVTQGMQMQLDSRAAGVRPEAWIADLPSWRLTDHKRLRKDLAFARRATREMELVDRGFDAEVCHALYAATVARNSGTARYGSGYFVALAALAIDDPLLAFFVAKEGSRIRGFAVVALHGKVANYLHGAVDAEGRRQGVSDLLLERLVSFARDARMQRFTLMASPWTQPGLLRFKEKWADRKGLSVTYDYGYGLLGTCAARASRWRSRKDRIAATHAANPEVFRTED